MAANDSLPLFVAQETLCTYPISTVYNSCPRYLYYALLFVSCATRWRGWLADVFLGTAATYAGTAAIQAFILVASRHRIPGATTVSVPRVPNNTDLTDDFPSIVTDETQIPLRPFAQDLDGDAVLAIVVTGYLVFLPMQCWSRSLQYKRSKYAVIFLWNLMMLAGTICALVYWPVLERTPTQYMFCNPLFPPADKISSDGWQPKLWTSTWNDTVWGLFGNDSRLQELESVCFYPCFNTSQILRQATSLEASVAVDGLSDTSQRGLWSKVIYSKSYIYALIAISVGLNFALMTFQVLAYPSRIPSLHASVIWTERKSIYSGIKEDLRQSLIEVRRVLSRSGTRSRLAKIRHVWRLFSPQFLRHWIFPVIDVVYLIAFGLSVVASPFTAIAFVVWIEWYIRNDGPPQENVQQVGQWSPLVALGLVLISAGILRLRYQLASMDELDHEIIKTRSKLDKLEGLKRAQSAKHPRPQDGAV
ncbi:hypothetical protein P170DRAFT_448990 [Aspergillus steynii IBT 23096]|uniref:Uncharacterized protein n=1 Tax=Aspergillus steynii IBT 23096 TaxID=1392250 RepID=A0A2I2G3A4_9EURO|nr:uncharacterized protein P170DRAFT_448990 [Aspergillus steynii IBT 23096]PLB47363.1 hypothetical protein P170DRAFT_448990 [Aspergillus steynii IBT 23096]